MDVRISGQDYFYTINEKELGGLSVARYYTTLRRGEQRDLGKVAGLGVGKTTGLEGIDLRYKPVSSKSWVDIGTIEAIISPEKYEELVQNRMCSATYDGENRVWVMVKERD